MRMALLALAFAGILASGSAQAETAPVGMITWRDWDAQVFIDAKREHHLVLLDVGAGWCHWCHVMDEITYRDPAVVKILSESYITVRVDQEARPDLANRYGAWGWPATILFDADGKELAKRRGYLPPIPMAGMLAAFVADPTPGPSAEAPPEQGDIVTQGVDDARRTKLEQRLDARWDTDLGGWGKLHKFLDAEAIEYSMRLAMRGDATAASRTRATLDANLALIDAAWGGVYQYSVGNGWHEPHFEKIMAMQVDNLRLYSYGWALWHDERYLNAAKAIRRYLHDFLTSPDGAFYVSQDADLIPGEHSAEFFALDDAARRARGIPRIDQHLYTRENGWVIAALADFAALTSDATALVDAKRAAMWIEAHRIRAEGGFRHDEHDVAGPYLGDALAMARAYLALHQATLESRWLEQAQHTLIWIDATFRRTAGGYATATAGGAAAAATWADRDENLHLARCAMLVSRLFPAESAAMTQMKGIATHAYEFVSAPAIADQSSAAGLLLADLEAQEVPMHLQVVGRADDPATIALLQAGTSLPLFHRQIELITPGTPAAAALPKRTQPFALACAGARCSSPLSAPAGVTRFLLGELPVK